MTNLFPNDLPIYSAVCNALPQSHSACARRNSYIVSL